jgi:hypothetical protein
MAVSGLPYVLAVLRPRKESAALVGYGAGLASMLVWTHAGKKNVIERRLSGRPVFAD